MAAAAVEKVVLVSAESKSARKKKAKAVEAANANGTAAPATPQQASHENSATADADTSSEHPYLKELQKQIRNINKKLALLQKTDSVIAENPGVSLDDLVAQRKLNLDQKAAAIKKPGLQAQLAELEERQEHYRKFDAEYQTKLSKQRDDLTAEYQKQLDKAREELHREGVEAGAAELRKKLLLFSQFLRAAAAKRNIEEEVDTEESRAFEGALLLVYGGDQKAVDTAVSLIDGTDEQVPSIEGIPLSFTYKQVKQASVEHAPFQTEEAWVDQVAEATGGEVSAGDVNAAGSDPTITHAGLTELEAPSQQPNGVSAETTHDPTSAADGTGNVAGERWDTDAAGTAAGAEKNGLEESYEMISRPSEEVDVPAEISPVASTQQPQTTSWADEPHDTSSGNVAGEAWDTKAAGDQTDNSWGAEPVTQANGWGDAAAGTTGAVVNDDGFHEVPGRHRGRGGHRGRGDGEFRGRGGRRGNFRGRGDGEFRGRGGFRGSRGGDGEFKGGRGRGRGGPRGGAESPAVRA